MSFIMFLNALKNGYRPRSFYTVYGFDDTGKIAAKQKCMAKKTIRFSSVSKYQSEFDFSCPF